jgi:glycosyltransferase involved in cell wall biosynthesis
MADNMASERTDIDDILVIIPVLNEEDTIVQVIDALHNQGLMNVRVVDNGSSDRSKVQALSVGAEVIDEPRSGYGQACWQGLQSMSPEIEWILFCDGDGSDDFSTLPQWFKQRDRYDFILGDRTATAAGRAILTPIQRFGNRLATTFIRWGWGYRYRDLGPLRFIRRSALAQIQMQDRGFGWTLEMQVRAVELGLRICEYPVGYAPRQGGRSKISGTLRGSVQAGTIILSTLGRLYGRRLCQQWGLKQ